MKLNNWIDKKINICADSIEALHTRFEISMFEKKIAQNPDHVESLATLGIAYSRAGRFEDALDADLRLSQLLPGDPVVHYNLACSHAQLKH